MSGARRCATHARRGPMMFAVLLAGALIARGCGGPRDTSVAASAAQPPVPPVPASAAPADAGAAKQPIVPAGWHKQWTYLHDTMMECLAREGPDECPAGWPMRIFWKANDAGRPVYDPYKYNQMDVEGTLMTTCCVWFPREL
jgi:hypothetical protein